VALFPPTGSDVLANVITGVALASVNDNELSFYFGCVAQATGMGGAGLFVGAQDDATVHRVYELRGNASADGQVRAGSMFLTESDMCDVPAIWMEIVAGSGGFRCTAPHRSAVAVASLWLLSVISVKSC